jgi:hypothetical protein
MSNHSEGGALVGTGFDYGRLCVGFHALQMQSQNLRLSARGIKILKFKTKTRSESYVPPLSSPVQYYLYTSLQWMES